MSLDRSGRKRAMISVQILVGFRVEIQEFTVRSSFSEVDGQGSAVPLIASCPVLSSVDLVEATTRQV